MKQDKPTTAHGATRSTIGVSSGKWYAECMVGKTVNASNIAVHFGLCDSQTDLTTSPGGGATNLWSYYSSGTNRLIRCDDIQYDFTTFDGFEKGGIIQVAVDIDNHKIWLGYNNQWVDTSGNTTGDPATSVNPTDTFDTTDYPSNSLHLYGGAYNNSMILNTGQDSSFAGNKSAQGHSDSNGIGDFYYEPPTDFLALCTDNLPAPTVVPSEHFDILTWSGDGSTDRAITGLEFAPDLVWIKDRTAATNQPIQDTLRGPGERLWTNNTEADNYGTNAILSFNSDGFNIGNATTSGGRSGDEYVAWCWKANGSPVSNTDGSITSQVSANVDAGFSIVSYTSPNTTVDETVGHGLSSVPELIIAKNRDNTYNWDIYHKDLASGNGLIFTTAAATANRWTTTAPTSSVFSVLWNYEHYSTNDYIAYCFHSVDGYSKVGSYTGNGSTDGTFVYTGFRPAYVMVKATSISGESWHVLDSKRDTYNVNYHRLTVNGSYSENTNDNWHDFTSNGFKIRWDNAGVNQNNVAYIFYAVAETDFKHSNAR